MKQPCILVLDQGTTNLKILAFDPAGRLIASARQATAPIYPRPGWVEQDARSMLAAFRRLAQQVWAQLQARQTRIAAVAITNQTESIVVWERDSGRPVYNAITWQCQRTADQCRGLQQAGLAELIHRKTGLPLDPAFSATKIKWLFEHLPGLQAKARQGRILAGTLDTWLVWNLSNGRLHITDGSNASRTMLFNIQTRTWDPELLEIFGIPIQMLPTVRPSSHIYGTCPGLVAGADLPVGAMVGDQQASLFGQGCLEPGDMKVTYGTGAFLYLNTGSEPIFSDHGLVTTLAWERPGQITYALEGFVQTAGAAIQWLREGLGIIDSIGHCEQVAAGVSDCGDVYFVPALTGLGAPFWDSHARGTIIGLTPGSSRAHLVRAALEGICFQVCDAVTAMQRDIPAAFTWIRADGAASANDLLLQTQADLLDLPIRRFAVAEATALGAAKLAGLAAGLCVQAVLDADSTWFDRTFEPAMDAATRATKHSRWGRALDCARNWAGEDERQPSAPDGHPKS